MGRLLDLLAFWRRRDARGTGSGKSKHHRRSALVAGASHRIVPPFADHNGGKSGTDSAYSQDEVEPANGVQVTVEVLREEHDAAEQTDLNEGKGKGKRRISDASDSAYPPSSAFSRLAQHHHQHHLSALGAGEGRSRTLRSPKRPRLEPTESETVVEKQLLACVTSAPTGRPRTFPAAVWTRIVSHLCAPAFDDLLSTTRPPSSLHIVQALDTQAHLHSLRLVSSSIKSLVEPSIWKTVVVCTLSAMSKLAERFEAGAEEGKRIKTLVIAFPTGRSGTASLGSSVASTSTALSTSSSNSSLTTSPSDLSSLPSLLLSLSSSVGSLHFLGSATASKALRSLASQASAFGKLEKVVFAYGVATSDICKLVSGCRSLKSITVLPPSSPDERAGSLSTSSSTSTLDPRFCGEKCAAPSARLTTLELGRSPTTAHELLFLVRASSSSLRSLGVTLAATPASAVTNGTVDLSTRRALVKAFGSVGKGLENVWVGESWADPISRGVGRWDPKSSVRPSPATQGGGTQGLAQGETVMDEVLISLSSVTHLTLASSSLYSPSILPVLPFTLNRLTLHAPCGVGPDDVEMAKRGGMALVGLRTVEVVRTGPRGATGGAGGWNAEGVQERMKRLGIEVRIV